MRGLLPWILAGCALAQAPEELLRQVQARMLDNLLNQPNYTCLETVERTRQSPGGGQHMEDTIRLEVAVVDGKEMFAWPGAKQFEDKELREVVSTGMFGNGNYALYARMIFGGGGPRLVYGGESAINGTRVARFDFEARAPRSGYYLRVDEHKMLVGFHGSAYVDLATGDLRRLEIAAQDIPTELRLTAAEDRVEYARVVIGDEEFLLPTESALMMAGPDQVSRNRTRFSACRKFTGESALMFDDPEMTEVRAPEVVEDVAVPRDVLLSLEIRSDLRLAEAAVGDVVEAVLRGDLKQGKVKVVPKGSTVKGRIVQLDRWDRYVELVIRFTDIEWPGHHAEVRAKFERRAMVQPRYANVQGAEGAIVLTAPVPKTLKGEMLLYRTER